MVFLREQRGLYPYMDCMRVWEGAGSRGFNEKFGTPHLTCLSVRPTATERQVCSYYKKMKFALVIAAIALLALAGVQADSNHRSKDGMARVMASSKTIVTVEPNLHRFCIPIGKTSIGGPKSVSLHVPRSLNGFEVKLDTSPLNSFISPTSANDKHCKKVSSLFLVRDSQDKSPFVFSQSEIAKAGAISGFIVGNKPSWISVRMTAGAFTDVIGGTIYTEALWDLTTPSERTFHEYTF